MSGFNFLVLSFFFGLLVGVGYFTDVPLLQPNWSIHISDSESTISSNKAQFQNNRNAYLLFHCNRQTTSRTFHLYGGGLNYTKPMKTSITVDSSKSVEIIVGNYFLNMDNHQHRRVAVSFLEAKKPLIIRIHTNTGLQTVTVPIKGMRRTYEKLPEECRIT